MGSVINPDLKCGVTLNGVDVLQLDPTQVKTWLHSLPEKEKEVIKTILENSVAPDFKVDENYAKDYGRPPLSERPYMTCENDGMPYLGGGHSPNCDGTLTYKENIYTKRKICWCMWASKATKGRRTEKLWKDYDNNTGIFKNEINV